MNKLYLGAIGNGETVALIGPGLSVEWLCVPRPDSFPVFARALDPARGGALDLTWRWADGPAHDPRELSGHYQWYRGRTNILETGARAGDLAIAATDYMPWGRRHLIRRITLTNHGSQTREARVDFAVSTTESAVAPPALGERVAVAFRGEQQARLAPGDSFTTLLVLGYGESLAQAEQSLEAATDDLEAEERFWSTWLAGARPVVSGDPGLDEAYYRSLLALKLLCMEQTGAILAAPTASFPAIPGGGDNWDYRYCWLRDGYFISRCLDAAGLHRESRRFYDLVLRFQEADGLWRQVLYTVDGGNPQECEVPDLAGPGGERPIRFGNAASTQRQIDNEPNVLLGLWSHWQATKEEAFVADRWDQIRRAADALMQTWQLPENGIWEIRERMDHWVYGKALCAAGLRAAAEMADVLEHGYEAVRWGEEAEKVREEVIARGWSPERQAYLQTYDDRSPVDISVLALSLWGLLPADDPRLRSTVALIEQPLKRPDLPEEQEYTTDTPFYGIKAGGLNMAGAMARYDYAAVPFYLPTLWLARHYRLAGQSERALELVRLCLSGSTNLGLMAEHFDPRTGGQWGNFPQGFSHEEMALVLLELFGEPTYRDKGWTG